MNTKNTRIPKQPVSQDVLKATGVGLRCEFFWLLELGTVLSSPPCKYERKPILPSFTQTASLKVPITPAQLRKEEEEPEPGSRAERVGRQRRKVGDAIANNRALLMSAKP
jgi:hypothetical protein